MKRSPAVVLSTMIVSGLYSCGEFVNKKEVIYDTIAIDTVMSEADRCMYGKIGRGSTMKELNLQRAHDSILFDITDCRILGAYVIGDSVAVVASGNEKASQVIDLSTLSGEWSNWESDTTLAQIKFLANKRLETEGVPGFEYDNWAIMNGDFIFSKQTEGANGTTEKTDIYTIDLLNESSISFHNDTDTLHFKREHANSAKTSKNKRKRK